jgi:putative transposase
LVAKFSEEGVLMTYRGFRTNRDLRDGSRDKVRQLTQKVRFTEEQVVTILREGDKSPGTEVAREHKISEHDRRGRFGNFEPADVERLRELEGEKCKAQARGCGAGDGDRDA